MMDYTLTHGAHATRDDGMCLMEAVAYLAGEPHTDSPACACRVLTAYAISLNDAMGAGPDGDALRARYLHDLAPMLVGSKSTLEVERARAVVLADHAMRVFVPLALESAGLNNEAARLRMLGAVMDGKFSEAARAVVTAAGDAAKTAAKAAWDAAWLAKSDEILARDVADAKVAKNAECAARKSAWAAREAALAATRAWRATHIGRYAAPAGEAAGEAAGHAAAWEAARAALVVALEAAP